LIAVGHAALPFFLGDLRKTIKDRRVGILAGIGITVLLIKSASFSGHQRFKKEVTLLLRT
jgi:hypothetical protein